MIDARDFADRLIPLMVEVGRLQLCHYRSGVAVERKGDKTPVTAADRESEVAIERVLKKLAPQTPIVAEEAASDGRIPDVSGRFFLVDPLDGTREFINNRNEFTVNIGLVDDHRAVFGMVYAPALSQLYVTVGRGEVLAGKLEADGSATGLSDLALRPVAARTADCERLTVVASRSHGDEATEQILSNYNVTDRRGAGSSLKFCLIAAGEADFYPRPGRTMEWDTCAGHAILSAAGGSVTTLDGDDLFYGKVERGFANSGFLAWGRRS